MRKKNRKSPAPPPAGEAPAAAPAPVSSGRTAMWLLGALAFLLYANTLGNGYAVDDGTVMENNTLVKQGAGAIPALFATRYRAGFWDRKENLYRPLSLVMFAVEWQLAPGNPFPGHLANVLLYALTVMLLFVLLRRMLPGRMLVPFVAALLFAAHPLHTEVVANIKSRDEILGFLFVVLALIALLAWQRRGRWYHLFLSVFCFIHAMLSKENAVMALFLAPLTVYFFAPFDRKRFWTAVAAYVLSTGLYLAIRASVLGGLAGETELQLVNNSLVAAHGLDRLASAFHILGRYLWLLVVPYHLVFDYSYNQIPNVTLADLRALVPLALAAAMLVYAVRRFGKKDILSFCILFFAVSFSLVSNVVFLIESTMAERFLYMPSFAFCLAAAVLLARAFRARDHGDTSPAALVKSHRGLFAVLAVVVALYGGRTVARNADWEDNLTLLAHDVTLSPESARIRYAYGSAILVEQALKEENPQRRNGLLDQAIVQLEKGVSILDTYSDAYYHLGLAYKEKGDFAAAVRSFGMARRNRTFTDADFYVASGIAYGSLGRYDKAIADLKQAIALDSASFDGYNNLGIYYTDSGQTALAVPALSRAHALQPSNAKPVYNLGNAYARAGDYQAAVGWYRKAVALDPGYEDAYNNIGNCYAAMRDYAQAIDAYKQVIEINPSNAKVLNNLGVTYKLLGDDANGDRYLGMAQAASPSTQAPPP